MYLQKVISRKQFFVGVLKFKDENSRIRIRIHWSEVRIRGSRSVTKCHGPTILIFSQQKNILLEGKYGVSRGRVDTRDPDPDPGFFC
jgi:hypothetical protein